MKLLLVVRGLSRPISVTDGKGQVTTTTYEALDRVTQVSFAGGISVTYDYDLGGRLVERTEPRGTTTYGYDTRNQLVAEEFLGATVAVYGYDGVGNLIRLIDAAGRVIYGYNAVNLVASLFDSNSDLTSFAYDDDDNRTLTSYPNGVTQAVTYDASSRLKVIEGKRGTTTLTRFSYTYAKAGTSTDSGLRHSVTDKDGNVTTYGYDGLDRLTSAVTKNPLGAVTADYGYDYDASGNRTTETRNGVVTSATFNAADQLTSGPGGSYGYDANGNLTAGSGGVRRIYNGADQTTFFQASGRPSMVASYAGTTQVERATAAGATFTNSLLGVTAARDASTTGYTRDPGGVLVGMRSGPISSYYLVDGLGSVVALTNDTGVVTNSYTYDPYGVTTEVKAPGTDFVNPWRYAGQFQDNFTGLYKMGARYYQPELGRWTQPDPSGLEANAYLYVGGNPVNFVDPSGLNPFGFIIDAIGIKDALEDLVDRDRSARDLLDNLAGGAASLGFATACAYIAGALALPTAGIGGLVAGGICAVLAGAAGGLIEKGISDG